MKPEEFIGDKAEYDKEGQIIWGVTNDDELQMLLNVRGWGAIQHLFNSESDAMKFQDEVGQWFTDAINEKLEREKPLTVSRLTFDGREIKYSELLQQHLSNIYWFNTVLHNRHHDYDEALLQELAARFDGEILLYKPLRKFKAEINLLRKFGYIQIKDDIEVVVYKGEVVGELEKE